MYHSLEILNKTFAIGTLQLLCSYRGRCLGLGIASWWVGGGHSRAGSIDSWVDGCRQSFLDRWAELSRVLMDWHTAWAGAWHGFLADRLRILRLAFGHHKVWSLPRYPKENLDRLYHKSSQYRLVVTPSGQKIAGYMSGFLDQKFAGDL